jgi:8-oxo-dGTP pyrophosphatase MutT (NUDIX family)
MNSQELAEQIKNYIPFNEQEERDKVLILQWLKENENAFSRKNTVAHMTASAWVVNKDRTKVLMVYHNIYNSWSWLGGHADGEKDLLKVAVREVKEEAGIQNVHPVSEEIFSLESLTVDGHVKNGSYISSHLHFNVTYLLEADSEESVSIKPDENSGVSWFTPEEALKRSTEPWFVEHVYSKLLDKIHSL